MNPSRQHRLPSPVRPARLVRRALAASLIAAFGGSASPAWAQLPHGLQIANGTAPVSSNGTQMTITNSPNAVLNWQSFSVGAGNSVRFQQETAASRVLNRVVGNDQSEIMGNLSSNGEVWLVNPHGVMFGQNARVDVGGLVASTLGVTNADFINGVASFNAGEVAGGRVVNQGEILTSFGGRLWLLGDSVRNDGKVESSMENSLASSGGHIVLAAGKSIDLVDSGAPNVIVRVSAPENEVLNVGSLLAERGGKIDLYGAIVNQDGVVRANAYNVSGGTITIKATGDIRLGSASVTAATSEVGNGGQVLIDSVDGTTSLEGRATVFSLYNRGGAVHLLGQQVDVRGSAVISASGGAGGGEVLVGGDSGGANPLVHNALATSVGPLVNISANTLDEVGDGGKIVVWSDGATTVAGNLQAQGGQYANSSGAGGLVETAGLVLEANPQVNVTGSGSAGRWLIGAGSVTIGNGAGTPMVQAGALATALANGTEVVVRAGSHGAAPDASSQTGDIVLASPIGNIQSAGQARAGASLTLEARAGIIVNAGAGLTAERAPLDVSLVAGSGIALQDDAQFVTAGGDLLLAGGGRSGEGDGSGTSRIDMKRGVLNTGSGRISMMADTIDVGDSGMLVDAGQIDIEAHDVRLDNTVLRAADSGSGNITIAAESVVLNEMGLHAAGRVNVTGSASVRLASASLSSDAEGNGIFLSAGSLRTSASYLTTPNGYWLVYLGPGQTAFPALMLDDLGYTYVQVNAAAQSEPVRTGIGQHGVLMADAMDLRIKVNASREYDGTDRAEFRRVEGQTGLLPGMQLAQDTGDMIFATTFQDKTAGLDKPIVYEYASPAFMVTTASDKPVFGATSTYVADITRKPLAASLVAVNKVYDATRAASLSGSVSGMIAGDSVTLGSATGLFDTKNVGTGKTVTFTGATLSGADAANYTVTSAAASTANISARPLGANGLSVADKVYDATLSATLSGALAVLPGDAVTFSGASALFDTKDVGSAKTVTISGAVLGGADAANYTWSGALTVNAAITHRPLAIAVAGEVRKEYDATTAATLGASQFLLDGVVAGEELSVTGPATASFDTKNVGQFKRVNATGSFAIGGAAAANYRVGAVNLAAGSNLVEASASGNVGTVTARPITATVVAANKVYDATRDAALSGTLSGVLAGDSASLTGATGRFDTKDAGVGKTVTYSGATLGGADGANYTLTGSATVRADITPRPIGATGLRADDKVYDGTRVAALSGALTEVLAGDAVSLTGASGLFDTKDTGTGKAVTLDSGVLAGADAGNYLLASNLEMSAAITHRPLEIAMTGEVRKEYDATTAATLAAGQFRLDGVLASDSVSVSGPGQGSFDSRHVGQGKQVTASGTFAISGADASNYRVGGVNLGAASNLVDASASANIGTITARPLSATVVAANKVYDATRVAELSGSLSGVLAGDSVSLSGATGLFDTKHAGLGKTVTFTGASLTGADAGNYSLTSPATTRADIAPRAIQVSGLRATDKVYDGNVGAVLSGALDALPGDLVTLQDATGQFDTKDVGAAKAVKVTGGALGGADAANYTLSMPLATSGAITHRPLEIGLAGDIVKEYDATTLASFGANQFVLTGLVANESVTVSGPAQGSYDSANAGQRKPVSATGTFAIAGADAANYRVGTILLASTSTLVSASVSGNVGTITPAPLVYRADPAERGLGVAAGALGGTITGWKGSDQLASATSGTLQWVTSAGATSVPGVYPVEGSGLTAANYTLVQHPGNASALRIIFDQRAPTFPSAGIESSAQASAAAVQAAVPTLGAPAQAGTARGAVTGLDGSAGAATSQGASAVTGLGASDVSLAEMAGGAEKSLALKAIETSEVAASIAAAPEAGASAASRGAAAKTFSAVSVGSMNHGELTQMIDRRKDFKKKLFADAIDKLDIDPKLADVQPCVTIAEASSGACRITPDQLATLYSAKAQTPVSVNSSRPKVASVPQIERKIAVLFGINDYQDGAIPKLENAVPDVEAIGRQFAEKLGYEVSVVRNPTKADIIRTLNELATRVNPSDSVVIYYAGHGYSLEKNGAGYWLAADANVNEPASWVSNSDIAQMLTAIRSRQMSLISDSCYSGGFAREGMGAVGQNVKVEDVLAKRSVVVLSSGGDEPVADEGKDGHSIFAWHLMQVVGAISDWKQGSTIFTDVQARVKKDFPQTPKYGSVTAAGHQAGGDFLFELRTN